MLHRPEIEDPPERALEEDEAEHQPGEDQHDGTGPDRHDQITGGPGSEQEDRTDDDGGMGRDDGNQTKYEREQINTLKRGNYGRTHYNAGLREIF